MVAGLRQSAERLNKAPDLAPETVPVQGLSPDGRGIAHVNGKAVFVEGALPGEEVEFRTVRHRHDCDEARVARIHCSSPERLTPGCAHFWVCGGCVLQHLAPAAQLAAKQQILLDNLQDIGRVRPESKLPPLAGRVWGYRRRARLSARRLASGRVVVGFSQKNGRHVTDTRHCEILDPRIGTRVGALAELLAGLSIADKIPQVEVAAGDDQLVLLLRVLAEPNAADRERLLEFEREHELRFYLQTGRAEHSVPLTGKPARLSYRLPEWNLELEFEPADFIQINAWMNRRLIRQAIELLQVEATHRVLDLFCGLGNFTLPLARVAAEAVGVEGEAGLVRRARTNAERNGLANVGFHQADLFTDQRAAAWLSQPFDRLLLDPPWAGAGEILGALGAQLPPRIVYVSCHPATLARDAGLLVHRQGYRLLSAGVLDMFPHTAHVESMAVLEKAT